MVFFIIISKSKIFPSYSLGFPRSDICIECELFGAKIKTLNLENSFVISDFKEKQQKHQIDSDFFLSKKK